MIMVRKVITVEARVPPPVAEDFNSLISLLVPQQPPVPPLPQPPPLVVAVPVQPPHFLILLYTQLPLTPSWLVRNSSHTQDLERTPHSALSLSLSLILSLSFINFHSFICKAIVRFCSSTFLTPTHSTRNKETKTKRKNKNGEREEEMWMMFVFVHISRLI